MKGYYEVASSRFVDSICQSVHTKLFTKCRDELIQIIEQELGIFKDNGTVYIPPHMEILLSLTQGLFSTGALHGTHGRGPGTPETPPIPR